MRTTHCSSHWGGGVDPDPPEFPSWMLAWAWSIWISPLDMGLDLISLNFNLGVGLDLIPHNFPLGCGPGSDPPQFQLGCGPGSDPPQFPPWVWAWTWSLAGGLLGRGVSLAGGSLWGGLPGRGVSEHALRQTPPVDKITDICKNITLPQTSFKGGKKMATKGSHIDFMFLGTPFTRPLDLLL